LAICGRYRSPCGHAGPVSSGSRRWTDHGGRHKDASAVFQPGYRWDALVVFPEPGDYCILNEVSAANTSVNQNLRPTQLLGTAHVGGTPVSGDLSDYLKAQLQAAAAANLPQDVPAKVTAELADGLKLTSGPGDDAEHPDRVA
jgi:hypothetical protein